MTHTNPSPRPRFPLRRPSARGFTLVELMVTVAIVAILAAVAIWSVRANTDQSAMDEWAGNLRNLMKEARSRAINSGKTHILQVGPTRARVCEERCWGSGLWRSNWVYARNGARVKLLALSADVGIGARPTTYNIGSWTWFTWQVYFRPDGTADSQWWTTTPQGVTLYLQHDKNPKLQYRIAVLPLSADIRKFLSWD